MAQYLHHFAASNALNGETQYTETPYLIMEAYQEPNPDGILIQYLVFPDGSYVAFPADINTSIVTATPDNVREDNLGNPQ